MSNMMIFAYIIFGISVIIGLLIKASQKQETQESATLYTWGIETHDLETWRKRAMDNTKDKNTKSILKYSDKAQLLGLMYILYGWDLMPCK